jgi:hypothetical protein
LPFNFKSGKEETKNIEEEILNHYLEQIVLLVSEILDETIPFKEKI